VEQFNATIQPEAVKADVEKADEPAAPAERDPIFQKRAGIPTVDHPLQMEGRLAVYRGKEAVQNTFFQQRIVVDIIIAPVPPRQMPIRQVLVMNPGVKLPLNFQGMSPRIGQLVWACKPSGDRRLEYLCLGSRGEAACLVPISLRRN